MSIVKNGKTLAGIYGGITAVDITQAEYDALPKTKLTDGKYYNISDGEKVYDSIVPKGNGLDQVFDDFNECSGNGIYSMEADKNSPTGEYIEGTCMSYRGKYNSYRCQTFVSVDDRMWYRHYNSGWSEWKEVSTGSSGGGNVPEDHSSPSSTYGLGTTEKYGHVKLSDETDSTSGATSGTAATPKAVKSVKDECNSINEKIPSDATSENKLVSQSSLNGSLAEYAKTTDLADYATKTDLDSYENLTVEYNPNIPTKALKAYKKGKFVFINGYFYINSTISNGSGVFSIYKNGSPLSSLSQQNYMLVSNSGVHKTLMLKGAQFEALNNDIEAGWYYVNSIFYVCI